MYGPQGRRLTTPMSRRGVLGLGGGAALAGMLAACSGNSASGGGDGEIGGTVRFAWWGNAQRQEVYTQFAQAFSEQEPEVTVQVEPAEYSAYLDRIAVQAGGRDLPDVFWLPANQVTSYAANDVLLDVETLPSGVLDLSAIPADQVDSWRIDGVLNALVYSQYSPAIQIDTTALSDVGIDGVPDDESWDWDDFMALAQEYADAAGDGNWGIATQASFYQHAHMWIRQQGAEVFDQEGNIGFDEAVLADWYQFWQNGIDAGAVMPPEITAGQTQWTQTNHQTALYMVQLNQFADNAGFSQGHDLQLAKYPVAPSAGEDYQFHYYTRIPISAVTENAATAGAFVDYMLNDPSGAEMVGLASGIPVNPDVVDAIRDLGDETDLKIIEMQDRIDQQPMRLRPEPPPAGADWQSLIEDTADNIFNGGQPIGDAVAAGMADLQRQLDRG
ncbi:ABC transporter substrate-binding protein [Georgenia deserti]|uniref:ABC transporter substrate-binding protein n=1 Tax=Georgenia deserti TaxID=2093781 RepID=A0ABW4L3S9_9MICO